MLVSDIDIVARAKKIVRLWHFQGKQMKWKLFALQVYQPAHNKLIHRMEQILKQVSGDTITLQLCEVILLIYRIVKKELQRGYAEQQLWSFLPQDFRTIASSFSRQ